MKKSPLRSVLKKVLATSNMTGMMLLGVSAMVLLVVCPPVRAEPVMQCHCFKDRSFDPKKPILADPYLLATAQNSFLASVFKISKKDIVRAKMSGVKGDDLWIANYLAGLMGRDANSLLNEKEEFESWKAVVASLPVNDLKKDKSKFHKALINGASDKNLAFLIVDNIFIRHLQIKSEEIKKVRALGARGEETILAVFLSIRLKCSPSDVYRPISLGETSWGRSLDSLGIDTIKFVNEWETMLK